MKHWQKSGKARFVAAIGRFFPSGCKATGFPVQWRVQIYEPPHAAACFRF
jgi:hypothetical protein